MTNVGVPLLSGRAECARDDVERWERDAFFAEKRNFSHESNSVYEFLTEHVKMKFCKPCKVREECLEYALKNKVDFGVWGGMTREERRKLLRRLRSAV